ncbi:MAG: hypothetical protein AAF617_05895 [Bacteroidota bacterium]
MKKTKIKLSLRKSSISNLKSTAVTGGKASDTFGFTDKYYNTCIIGCPLPTKDCYTNDCENTNYICDQ